MVSRSQRLCLLCSFPAADGGVPLDALDADKWAAWCRRELGVEKIGGAEEERTLICQFCIWEARFVHESAVHDCCGMNASDGCDWWMGHDNDHFFREYFYKRSLIQPCKVMLEKISVDGLGNIAHLKDNCHRNNARLEDKIQDCQATPRVQNQPNNLLPKATTKNFKCSLCLTMFRHFRNLTSHMIRIHKYTFRCNNLKCNKYFLNEDERQQHEEKFHLNGEQVKCHFCGALISNYSGRLNSHIKMQHKEAIKCDYNKTCAKFFHTESEKKDHIFNDHSKGLQLKITPMKCIYCDKIFKNKYQLRTHVYNFHKDVRIKCKVNGCVVYFLNQKESDEHFLQVHQQAGSLKKWQCPKCSYKSSCKHTLRRHLQNIHLNKANMKSIFKCPQCPKSFHAKLNMKNHIKSVHAEQCTCQYCGKILQKVSMLSHYLGGGCKSDALTIL